MTYNNIQKFPQNANDLESSELKALSTVWKEKKEELEETGVYQEFIKKMQREWAIETGIIERLYTWDRGVTEVMIEQGIDASLISHKAGIQKEKANHIKDIIDDQYSIVEGLFEFVKGERPLSEHFIRGLQAEFTANQDSTEAITETGKKITISLDKGVYKTQPNNPRRPNGEEHWYCPPEQTEPEMHNLISWYKTSESKYSPEVRSAWLHHRFTQIHPFQDGNGRVARALATLVFLKDGLFPLVIRDSDRENYINALEEADKGDIKPLVNLFAKRQKEEILKALGLEQQVQQANFAEQIIAASMIMLKDKYNKETDKINQVYSYANQLHSLTEQRLNKIASSLKEQLSQLKPHTSEKPYTSYTIAANNDSENKHYFYKQIVEIANQFGYYANLDSYRSWIRLGIETDKSFQLIISIHRYGQDSNGGIMVASALTARKIIKEDRGSELVDIRPASTDLFQFNYIESIETTEQRYKEWLESSLAIALTEWKKLIAN